MKSFLVMGLALVSMNAMAADKVVGTATLTVYPEFGAVGAIDVNDIGTGLANAEGPGVLGKTKGGYAGFFLGNRYWALSCDSAGCQGNGPTSLDLTLTQVDGGYKLDGLVDFYPVTLTVTNTKIEVSVADNNNTAFNLDRQADGSYSGSGTTTVRNFDIESLDVTYAATGSLADAIKDPASAVILLVTPFVQ